MKNGATNLHAIWSIFLQGDLNWILTNCTDYFQIIIILCSATIIKKNIYQNFLFNRFILLKKNCNIDLILWTIYDEIIKLQNTLNRKDGRSLFYPDSNLVENYLKLFFILNCVTYILSLFKNTTWISINFLDYQITVDLFCNCLLPTCILLLLFDPGTILFIDYLFEYH